MTASIANQRNDRLRTGLAFGFVPGCDCLRGGGSLAAFFLVCILLTMPSSALSATGDVISSFPAPGTTPSGLAWDGTNLWHADRNVELIYELTTTGSVLSSFPAPATSPRGLTWDGTNLWLADRDTDTIYELTTTGTVLSSFSTPGTGPYGLTWDGTNLWLADRDTTTIYQLTITGTVLSSFPTPGTRPEGLTWDGTNLWLADRNTDTIYELTTTGTVLSSFPSPSTSPRGLSWDGTDFWLADSDTDLIYQLEGPVPAVCPGGVVTTTADSATGGSLRACIIWANGNPGTDTIIVPAGTYILALAGTGEDAAATGDLDITDNIVINGDPVNATIIDANGIDRVLDVLGASASMSNLTIRNGNVADNGGGIGVDSSGSLTLSNSTLSGNTASGPNDGGGIHAAGNSDFTNVTFNGNTAERGGGMSCTANCTITNSTVTVNTGTSQGGGIHQGGGGGTSITFLNTIVANNSAPSNQECAGPTSRLISSGYNISSDTTCDFTSTGDQENTNPLLGLLQDNGGPTFTHELLAGSPAIETGTNIGCPAVDQRGLARPAGANCDIGAFEAAAVAICPVTNTADSGPGSLRACLLFANSNPGTPIRFNIPGPGNRSAGPDSWWAISPLTPLPTISAANIVIDGTTQTANRGNTNSIGPELELDGTLAGGATHGLVIAGGGDGSAVHEIMINRFGGNGIQIQPSVIGATIAGNWIGSDGSGASAPGNGNNGINILGGSNTIGGTGAGDRNVINNNGNEGINLTGGSAIGNSILGNYIGLEYDGSSGSGNSDVGIAILSGSSGNTIGGLTAASRNVISMNFEGIEISSANNIVIGNYIGTDAGGTLDRGSRSDDGLEIQGGGNNNTIGGTAPGAGNLIAFSQRHGINIVAGTGNTVLGNSIHTNDLLGIDLGNNGVTTNDAGDVDSGANDLLNFPVITSAVVSGPNIDVIFGLDVPAGDYRIEFFKNASGADPSTYGEGENFANALTITHGGTGLESFSHSFAGSTGDILTATATEESAGPSFGATSEFSLAFTAVSASCAGGIVNNTADTGNRSLRECILFANANPGTTIGFSIAGVGNRSAGADNWFAISPLTPLPAITAAGTIIDGTTQTTNRGDSNILGPEIEIDGEAESQSGNGFVISATSSGSTIRGLAIGNFGDNGILLLGGNNSIQGNYIGLSADGTTVAANNTENITYQGGVRIESANNTIGGNTPADRNVISANMFAGVELFGAGASGNDIYGNYIGVDANGGGVGFGNSQEGIDLEFAGGNTIGGPLAGQRNIISGNGSDGIEIDGGDFNIVQNNYIGTDVTGTILIPNVRDGIDINENGGNGTTNTLVGGTGANEGNLIRGNDFYGVSVRGAPAINNAILGNRIFGNVLLGIDLDDDGITVNDPFDVDAGSNNLLNYPKINSAVEFSGSITVDFEADLPAGDYRIEFFTNPSGAHSSGNGEGEIFASAVTINHLGSGDMHFVHAFPGSVGDIITATATEELAGPTFGATSEFSEAYTATGFIPYSARWPLDETAGIIAAEVDAGNDGAYRNGVLLNQVAACTDTGNAVYFDGIDDFVEVPHAPDYLLSQGTVSLWANVDAIGAAQGLFSKDSTNFDDGGHLTIRVQSGGDVEVRLQSKTASMYVNSTPIVPGIWFHVAFSWGPAGMALYVNGATPVTDPYTGGLGKTSGGQGNFEPIAFGASTIVSDDLLVTPTTEHFAGYMDDVRLNNRALTLPEIQTLAGCTPAPPNLNIVKRAFWPDGTPIPTGATIPRGVEFKYLLYVNNPNADRTDVTLRDVLDPAFQYQAGTIQVDNSVGECVAAVCTTVEELSIFTAVNGAAVLSDAPDGDVASYTGAGASIDAGDGNAANFQLDINANAVWAILFSVKMP